MARHLDAINAALKDAMKNRDAARRDTIRFIISAIKQVEVDTRRELSAEEEMDILQKEAKKRRESISELEAAGREDQAAQEAYELGVLEEFLPKQLTREEIEAMVHEAIEQTGASSPRDMGKVMGALVPKTKGRADGKLVSDIVRNALS